MASQRPVRWRPPPKCRAASVALPLSVFPLPATGGEDILIEPSGAVVTGLGNGDIVRLEPSGTTVLGNTGGRPLGIEAEADGTLLICDHDKGLLRLDPKSGHLSTVVDTVENARLRFCSNAVVCPDGTIYFTTSSESATWDDYQADVIRHAASGRLIRVSPRGDVTVLARGLAFANGLELAPDGSFLLVAETIAYRIRKFWLTGPDAGAWSDFVTGLPGFPDNISLSENGLLWVALPAPRMPLLDFLLPRAPALRTLVLKLPQALHPKPRRIVWVQAYDLDGRLVHNIKTTHRRLSFVTGAAERRGALWLSSARGDVLARIDLPADHGLEP
ncbi:MAG: strictosidine synthase family protein [Methyloceanibacter sp.]|nr:MAG: strictosidine synthase family protein [Methyloceanibacter sp.]